MIRSYYIDERVRFVDFWDRTISVILFHFHRGKQCRQNTVPSLASFEAINSPNNTKSRNKNPIETIERNIPAKIFFLSNHTDLSHPRTRSNIVTRSRGQRRFPGIVITTFKRRRVNSVEWGPLCPFPSVLLSSVLCFTTSARHGLRLWETPSGRCQHLTLSDHFFSSLFFIFINIIAYPPNFSKRRFRYSIFSLYPSHFSFFFFYPFCVQLLPATPEGIVVNEEGSVLQWLLRVAPRRRTVIEKLAGGFKPLDILLREFD